MDELPASRFMDAAEEDPYWIYPFIVIKSAFSMLTGSSTENLMQVLHVKSMLASFAQGFSKSNRATVKQSMRKAHHVNYTFVWKRTLQQLNHEFQVLDKLDEVLNPLKSSSLKKAKCALKEGTALVLKKKKGHNSN